MRPSVLLMALVWLAPVRSFAGEAPVIARPQAFKTLVNPACSHCRDEAKRRAGELKTDDRVLCWTRGYSDGGAIPLRFFLAPYRVISDSYGVFVYDPDAGYARGFAPSYDFRFHGWRSGVMVMKHKDGTLYSCLSGVALDGPKKGRLLQPIPSLVSDWGFWLEKYPHAVAYHMFDKYQPVALPATENPDSVRSRGTPDPRLPAAAAVLGVRTGKATRAYPLALLEQDGILKEDLGGEPHGDVVLLWEPRTRTAAAYRPSASQPRKYQSPRPDASGVSPPDAGDPVPPGTPVVAPRKVTLTLAPGPRAGRFLDTETKSVWDVAGRCVAGPLAGFTLEWVDSVQVKWFAWAAEHPETSVYAGGKAAHCPSPAAAGPHPMAKAIAGKAEFLRLLPKPFARLKAVDAKSRTVTLVLEGETAAKVWPVETDAEVKVSGWWGRLEQFQPGARVWAWLKLNRQKKPVSVVMLADEMTEFDMHASLRTKQAGKPMYPPDQVEAKRKQQQAWLRQRWAEDGLPGTLTLHHAFSGELDVALDHEAMRWGRSLQAGNVVHLQAEPPIKAVVKSVTAWHERTIVRVIVGELESSELTIGQRLHLKMTPPAEAAWASPYPLDIGRARSKAERVEWFLASIYCTCGVGKDRCTGHFYTLASCNPNACGMPNHMRDRLGKMIERGLTDRQIFDELLQASGPLLLRPHLRP